MLNIPIEGLKQIGAHLYESTGRVVSGAKNLKLSMDTGVIDGADFARVSADLAWRLHVCTPRWTQVIRREIHPADTFILVGNYGWLTLRKMEAVFENGVKVIVKCEPDHDFLAARAAASVLTHNYNFSS